MRRTPQDLFAFLEGLGIAAETVTHPPLRTVAEAKALRGRIPGGHTKNLFLKDKKGRFFLVVTEEDKTVDLKSIHQKIGASGRVSFGSPQALEALLGVVPGAVTAFGVLNDRERQVSVVLDADLLDQAIINAHPLVNTATTSVSREGLLAFLEATGHVPLVLKVGD